MASRKKPKVVEIKPLGEWKNPPVTIERVFVAKAGQIVDWGVKLLGVPDLWKQTRGKGIKVAVLDTGAPDHPDVASAVILSKDFTGSRFGMADKNGHGTHCASIIAAQDNSIGVVGIAPEASLLAGKVLGDSGSGSSQSVANGIYWAIEQGADIISMSLGSPVPDQRIRTAVVAANQAGIYIVVAAGNEGPRQGTVGYPGRWPECISVASYNEQGQISQYSSRGPEVDIAAPGENITACYLDGQLAKLSGTSMACPAVAGVIALALSKYVAVGRDDPTMPVRPSPSQMVERLKQCAKDIDAPGFDPNSGWGLIDPAKLMEGFEPVPVPPPTPTPLQKLTIEVVGKDLSYVVR